jgi:hypothetical protein
MSMKMKLALGTLVVAISGLLLFLLWPQSSKAPIQQAVVATPQMAHYVVPQNIADYVKQVDEYTSSGGKDPSLTWTYDVADITVPEGSTTLAYAAEVAANQIKLGGGPSRASVTHFKVLGETAYVLLNIDEDGWAGVSFALHKIHPLVERTVLLDTSIKKVVFGLPPELKASAALQ